MIQPYLYLGDPDTDTVWFVEDGKVWATVCYSDLVSRMCHVGRTLPVDLTPAMFNTLCQGQTNDSNDIKELFSAQELSEMAIRQFDSGKTKILYSWDPLLVPLVGWLDEDDD